MIVRNSPVRFAYRAVSIVYEKYGDYNNIFAHGDLILKCFCIAIWLLLVLHYVKLQYYLP